MSEVHQGRIDNYIVTFNSFLHIRNFLGLSSIRRIIRCISGFDSFTDFATSFNNVVLPAFGCDTIIPLCPANRRRRSTIRIATELFLRSRTILSFGNTELNPQSWYVLLLLRIISIDALNEKECTKLIIRIILSCLTGDNITCFRLNLRICEGET